jgi:hypothetical protein
MTSLLRKTVIGSLAAVTLAAGVAATATPAAARWYRGYWYPGYGWYSGYPDWGSAVANGVLGGIALGTLAASAYAYGPTYYGYGGCYWYNRPTYDSWGNFMGYQPAEVCY